MAIYIPGFGQMTAAQQSTIRGAAGTARASGKRKRKTKKKTASASTGKKRKAKASKSTAKKRLVKGSAAAKAYMAKIRKMRKK